MNRFTYLFLLFSLSHLAQKYITIKHKNGIQNKKEEDGNGGEEA